MQTRVYVPAYGPNEHVAGQAKCFLPKEEADELIALGLAKSCKRGKAIQFTRKTSQEHAEIRDQSCQMGPRVSEANAGGKGWAQALVKGWKPQFRFA